MNISQIQNGLRNKEFSTAEIVHQYLDTIVKTDGDIHAFLEVYHEDAIQSAQKVDEYLASGGEQHPMTGIPIAIKDNMLIDGKRTTCASKILENYTATYDAGVIKQLKNQRAILLGKTNLDEFAMGSSTEFSAYGPTKNPHDLERVPGGSSGGSAAAVAANMAPASLGSDTGGSIRQPAHCTGVVGFKPTYGAVSRSGIIALASSLDQVGPFANTVKDAEIIFKAIAGQDPYDNTSANKLSPAIEGLNPASLRIGIPKEYFIDGIEPEVSKAIQSAIEFYRSLGAQIKEVSLPHSKYALSAYYIIQPAEASSNLGRFDGIRYSPVPGVERDELNLNELYRQNKGKGFGPETTRRILLGTYALSSGYYDAYYKKAIEAKEYITDDFNKVFEEVDVLLTPTAPTRAFKIGEKLDDPLQMYLSDIFTIPVNLAGLPAISIPVKQLTELPIGFQLIGKKWHDLSLLQIGQLYEN